MHFFYSRLFLILSRCFVRSLLSFFLSLPFFVLCNQVAPLHVLFLSFFFLSFGSNCWIDSPFSLSTLFHVPSKSQAFRDDSIEFSWKQSLSQSVWPSASSFLTPISNSLHQSISTRLYFMFYSNQLSLVSCLVLFIALYNWNETAIELQLNWIDMRDRGIEA